MNVILGHLVVMRRSTRLAFNHLEGWFKIVHFSVRNKCNVMLTAS
jgi:hypothetical protein